MRTDPGPQTHRRDEVQQADYAPILMNLSNLFTPRIARRCRTGLTAIGFKIDRLAALSADIGHHPRKTREHIDLSAMGTHVRTHVESTLHFIERPLEFGSRNGPHYGLAHIADDIGAVSEYDAVQTAVAIRIAK